MGGGAGSVRSSGHIQFSTVLEQFSTNPKVPPLVCRSTLHEAKSS